MFSLIKPPKFRFISHKLQNTDFTFLDVGCGNKSATYTKRFFPKCRYFGIDNMKNYNNEAEDFDLMEKFYEKDISQLKFEDIPNNFFDTIMITHVIEHLKNGEEVLIALLPKLKAGGVIYIEYPSAKSVNFPSKPETLNFYDDPTHVRIYDALEISKLLALNGMDVKKIGIRRSFLNIFLMPFKMVYNKIKRGIIPGSIYWDLYGFAEFVYAIKK